MYQPQINQFEYTKQRISESSGRIAKLLIWVVVLFFAIIILAMIAIGILIGSMGYMVDPSNPYAFLSVAFSSLIGLAVVLLLIGLALIVIYIIILVQYYQLGKGFSDLASLDPSLPNAKNASVGIYAYIIAYVLGVIIPGYFGAVVTILGTLALALGFYFIYQTFEDFRRQGRFNRISSKKLFIAVSLTFIANILNFIPGLAIIGVGGLFSIIGFILLILGMKDLERDILIIAPQGASPTQAPYQAPTTVPTQAPYQAPTTVPTQPAPTGQAKYCSNCGAKNEIGDKFCISCGAKLD